MKKQKEQKLLDWGYGLGETVLVKKKLIKVIKKNKRKMNKSKLLKKNKKATDQG